MYKKLHGRKNSTIHILSQYFHSLSGFSHKGKVPTGFLNEKVIEELINDGESFFINDAIKNHVIKMYRKHLIRTHDSHKQ